MAALQVGLESTLAHLGTVPGVYQTDHSIAATHTLSAAEQAESDATRGYNAAYLALLAYYDLAARTTHVRHPQENKDVEAGNGASGGRWNNSCSYVSNDNLLDFTVLTYPCYRWWIIQGVGRRGGVEINAQLKSLLGINEGRQRLSALSTASAGGYWPGSRWQWT